VARGLAGGAGRDGGVPARLRPPPRAPGLHPPDHRARSQGASRRVRRSWRRWFASCGTRAEASRWASVTRRSPCAPRPPERTSARSSRRSGRWRTGWRGGRPRRAPTLGNATLTAHIEVAESYGVKFKSVDVVAPATRRRAPGAALLRRRGVGTSSGDAQAGADRAGARGAVLAGRSCQDRTTPVLSPAEGRAWNDRRIQALQSIEYPIESALPAGAAGPCPPAPGRGVRVAGVRRSAPR
jgi:hypothetical protein